MGGGEASAGGEGTKDQNSAPSTALFPFRRVPSRIQMRHVGQMRTVSLLGPASNLLGCTWHSSSQKEAGRQESADDSHREGCGQRQVLATTGRGRDPPAGGRECGWAATVDTAWWLQSSAQSLV